MGVYKYFLIFIFTAASSLAANPPMPGSIETKSPFNDFTIGVMAYMLLVGVLVAVLLIGGFLIINLGLLSRRTQDRIGGRTPSDLGILKSVTWPNEPEDRAVLPADEPEQPIKVRKRKNFLTRKVPRAA